MPYTIRKQKCKQSDGDTGSYVLSYTDKKGKKHRACHTSKKKAQGQISAIEGPWESDEMGDKEEVMAERLLREMVREILAEASLTPADIDKYGSRRYDIFLQKMKNLESFELEQKAIDRLGTDAVIIPVKGNKNLVAALRNNDRNAVKLAFQSGVTATDETGNTVMLQTLSDITKTSDFGGRGSGEKSVPASIQNELDFAEHIKRRASAGHPITVIIGKYRISGVTGATQTGSAAVEGQTSKADVVLTRQNSKDVGVSLKLDSADYWLSGDRLLADQIGPFVEELSRTKSPGLRIQYDRESKSYIMLSGRERIKRIWFDISDDLKRFSVFGSGQNTVDVIAQGDFMRSPQWDATKRILAWPEAKTYRSIDDLADDDMPVGILRTGEAGRGMTYNGTKYVGIRPAIARKGFAARGSSIKAES